MVVKTKDLQHHPQNSDIYDLSNIEDYNSHNTKRLNIDEIKKLLLTLDLFKS